MHNHDYELIMALAEDSLDPAAAASARAEIGACPECAQDLELQTEGLIALRGIAPAGLTELESARLHRNLRQELGVAKQQARPPATRSRVPLAALGTAAAVLVAVVLVGPGLNLIGGADSSDDATQVAVATTSAAATTAAPAAGADMQNLEVGESFPDGTAEVSPEASATPTTAAPATAASSTTTTAATPSETAELFPYFREVYPDLEALRDDLAASAFDESDARSRVLRQADDSILEEDLGAAAACVQLTLTSEDNFVEGFQLARGRLDDREVILIVYLAEDLEESILIAHAVDTCEELGRAGP